MVLNPCLSGWSSWLFLTSLPPSQRTERRFEMFVLVRLFCWSIHVVCSLATIRSHDMRNDLSLVSGDDAMLKPTQVSPATGQSAKPVSPSEMPLEKRFLYSSSRARVPAADDVFFHYMSALCRQFRSSHAPGGVLGTHEWFRMYCEGDTVVVVCQRRQVGFGDTDTARHQCRPDEKCIERQGFLNPFGWTVSTAACVPDVWKWLVKQAKSVRGRMGGLRCGYATAIHPQSFSLASAMMDLTVHISRLRLSERSEFSDINAEEIFFWDNTNPDDPTLLQSVSDTARSSVSVLLEKGKRKDFEVCVVVPDYWQRREGEVVIDFMHSYQYDLVKTKQLDEE